MCAQSSLKILELLKKILELFRPYLSKDFKLINKTFTDKRTNNIYSSVSFATLYLPCFNYYRNIFYNSSFKIVPPNISKNLSPRALASRILDEG